MRRSLAVLVGLVEAFAMVILGVAALVGLAVCIGFLAIGFVVLMALPARWWPAWVDKLRQVGRDARAESD